MKKLIAFFCTFSAFGLALALANAEADNAEMTTEVPGSTLNPSRSPIETSRTEAIRTGTDASGVIYRRGAQGYQPCVMATRKAHKKSRQMGGTLDNVPEANPAPENRAKVDKQNAKDNTMNSTDRNMSGEGDMNSSNISVGH